MLVVERHYLRTYGGSFTEHFYGLKRERVLHLNGGEVPRAQIAVPNIVREALKLRPSDVWKNLAILVCLPYIKRKLDESYGIYVPQAIVLGRNQNRNSLPPDANIRQRILYYYKWFLRNIYPSINAAYHFSLLAFSLAYLFDNTKYSSPFLCLIGTRIRRMGEADYRAIELAEQVHTSSSTNLGARPGQTSSIFSPRTFSEVILPRFLSSFRILLPTSIFALKFLEWWHASDFANQLSRKATEDLDLPPPVVTGLPAPSRDSKPAPSSAGRNQSPPPVPNTVSLSAPPSTTPAPILPSTSPLNNQSESAQNSASTHRSPPISTTSGLPILTVPAPTSRTSSLCPICLQPIQTPTAAQTGYVFCYACIFRWVSGNHDRQVAWMEGAGGEEGWGEEEDDEDDNEGGGETNEKHTRGKSKNEGTTSRVGRWESGIRRCAVTGRRLLGGTQGLRRVIV
jgi:peroxin-12